MLKIIKNIGWRGPKTKERNPISNEILNAPSNCINVDFIENILEFVPREDWYFMLSDFLYTKDGYDNCYFRWLNSDNKFSYYELPFRIDDLKKDHFDVEPGDTFINKRLGGQYIAFDYITFDKRYREKRCSSQKSYARDIRINGSILQTVGIANGRISGFDIGNYPGYYFSDEDSSYYKYEKSNYVPERGQLLWYIKQLALEKAELVDEDYFHNIIEYATDLYIGEYKPELYEKIFKVTEE